MKNRNRKEMVYDAIQEGILNGEYAPNQILNEQELVARFGCSKSPVREALVSLCSEGVLKNLPRYGYEVVRLTEEDVRGILEFRLVLEGGYLRASRFSPEQLEELSRLDGECRRAVDDVWCHWEANTRFHLQLISCGGNRYAWQQLKTSMDILKRAYAQFYWGKWNSISPATDVRCHCEILKSLEKGDREEAVRLLHADLADFCGQSFLKDGMSR
jgi:DNA-binding GntR family transcriptional regulator